MEIAILIYDKLAALDAVGPYEVMRNVPGWDVRFVAKEKGDTRTEDGTLGLVADYSLDEVRAPDIVLVPGGRGSRPLMHDEGLLQWLRDVDRTTKWTTSVCTGSLLLGAAGLLEGKRATGNWLVLEALRQFGADPVGGRWVEDGKVDHRRRGHRRDRHGPAPGRPGGRARRSPRRSSSASSTTPTRPSTPARRRRRRRRSSSWSAPVAGAGDPLVSAD